MRHVIICEDAPKTDSDIPCAGTTRVYRLTKEDDYQVIGICTKHAEQRGYLRNPQFSPDSDAARAYLAAHRCCADRDKVHNLYGVNNDGKPGCEYNFKTHQFGPTDTLHVFYLPEAKRHVVLCKAHGFIRGYFNHPRLLPDEEGAQAYGRRQRYLEADRSFIQVYHSELICAQNDDSCAKDRVAEYYFSDGGILPLCTIHLPNTHALRISDAGHWMSKEYHDRVYAKRND